MAESDVVITVTIDDNGVKKSFSAIEDHAKDSGITVGKLFGASLAAELASKVIEKGLESFKDLLKDTVKEAMVGERAMTALASAMKINGTFSKEAITGFAEFSDELSRLTGVQDNVINQNAAMLVSIGKLSGDGLKRATKDAIDLAAGLQIDVGTAFNMMEKAATGNTMALSRWGIKVNENLSPANKYAEALKQIEDRFGGMAAMRLNTFDGATTAMSNGFEKIKESIGNFIVQSPFLVQVIKSIAGFFFDLAKSVEHFAAGKDLIYQYSMIILNFASTLTSALAPALDIVGRIVDSVINKMGQLAATLLALVAGDFGAAKEGIKSIFSMEGIDTTSSVGAGMQTLIDNMKTKAIELNAVAKQVGIDAGNNLKTGVQDSLNDVSGFENYWEFIKTGFSQNTVKISAMLIDLGKNIKNTIGTGLGNAFAAMGSAMVKGENMFKAFGAAIIGILGDIAMSAGQTFIGMGIAKLLLGDATGAGLIAAGAGLTLLGGVLKALAGSGSGATGGATSGGGVTSTDGGSPTSAVAMNETAMQKPGNQLIVNVQGSVLTDRREAGLYLAEVLQETLLTNGVLTTA